MIKITTQKINNTAARNLSLLGPTGSGAHTYEQAASVIILIQRGLKDATHQYQNMDQALSADFLAITHPAILKKMRYSGRAEKIATYH